MDHEPSDLGLETRTFAKGDVIAEIYDTVEHAFIIQSGRVRLEAHDRHDEPIKDFSIELVPGQIVFDELLAFDGEDEVTSEHRVVALEETTVFVLTLYDLVENPETVHAKRATAVINAVAKANLVTRRKFVELHEEELGLLSAMDGLRDRVGELEGENRELRHQVTQLDELNRSITRDVVNKAVLDELRRLSANIRELTSERRDLERQIIERTNEAKSAIDYAASLTDDLQRLERLRDLLELEASEPRVFLSEVQRAFLAILTTDNRSLQRLGIEGLGILSSLSRDQKTSPPDEEPDPIE